MKTIKTRITEIKKTVDLIMENDIKFEKKIISGRDWIEGQTEKIEDVLINISMIEKEQRETGVSLGYQTEMYLSMTEEVMRDRKRTLIVGLGY